ncbi:VCBS repeat-containing protein, partial [Planctomycetota bacterium]|nr:VCBS repeat-containing protein [Planctomycetota bacterium]
MKCSVLWLGIPAALLLTSSATSQTFGATERLTNTVLDPRDVLSGDLDGDGDLEPIALSGLDGQISYWDNRGGGNFGPQISLPSVEPGVDVGVSGDVDGNGTVDLIVGTDAGAVVAFLNDGSGGWTRIQVTQISSVVELACEDLNVDGIEDVVALSGTGEIEWFAGTQGSIPLAQGVIGQSNLAWLEILDLDGDSDPDVMLSNDADLLHYMENDGAGAFTASSELIWSGGALRRGHLVDFDGDGMPDVVRHLGSQITWDNGLPGGFNEALAVLQQVPFQEVFRVSPDL